MVGEFPSIYTLDEGIIEPISTLIESVSVSPFWGSRLVSVVRSWCFRSFEEDN
jgi:hypothetical protein